MSPLVTLAQPRRRCRGHQRKSGAPVIRHTQEKGVAVTDSLRDAPAVVVFPPTIPLGTVVLSGFLQWLYPLGLFVRLATPWRVGIGATLVGSGIGLMASGRRALTSGGTNVHPSRPAVPLVERGVYRWTR